MLEWWIACWSWKLRRCWSSVLTMRCFLSLYFWVDSLLHKGGVAIDIAKIEGGVFHCIAEALSLLKYGDYALVSFIAFQLCLHHRGVIIVGVDISQRPSIDFR
jgi:hypothetical protein